MSGCCVFVSVEWVQWAMQPLGWLATVNRAQVKGWLSSAGRASWLFVQSIFLPKAQINTATEAKDAEPEAGDAAVEHNAPAEDAAAQAPVADEQEAAEADEKAEEKSEA